MLLPTVGTRHNLSFGINLDQVYNSWNFIILSWIQKFGTAIDGYVSIFWEFPKKESTARTTGFKGLTVGTSKEKKDMPDLGMIPKVQKIKYDNKISS